MPTYSYQCDACASVTEIVCSIREYRPKMPCEACGSPARRLFRPCVVQTDSTFVAGAGTLLDQCGGNERDLRTLVNAARAQGYNPSPNDYYQPSLATSTGDPLAFVPQSGGRAHIKKVCRERMQDCHGAVEYKAPERPPRPKKPLAEKIVDRLVNREITRNPSLKSRPVGELREKIIERHAHRND